ncbi:hypothetical protein [Paenibacillus sp. LjRoot153]
MQLHQYWPQWDKKDYESHLAAGQALGTLDHFTSTRGSEVGVGDVPMEIF